METKLESLTRPEDLRTAAFKFRKNNPSSVSHDSAAMYIELSADRIEQLRQRVAELEYQLNTEIGSYASQQIAKLTAERDKAAQYWQIAEGRCDALMKQRDELLKAISIAEPVMDAHAGPSRLADFRAAIASVKGGVA